MNDYTKLLGKGWEQSIINPELFYHPEFGTHQIFKAAALQREVDIKIGRRVCFIVLVGQFIFGE